MAFVALVALALVISAAVPGWARDESKKRTREPVAYQLVVNGGRVIDVCTLLDRAVAEQILGGPIDDPIDVVAAYVRAGFAQHRQGTGPGVGECDFSDYFRQSGLDPKKFDADSNVSDLGSAGHGLDVSVASSDSLQRALHNKKVTAATRYDAIRRGIDERKQAIVEANRAQAERLGAPADQIESVLDIGTSDFQVTDLPDVGNGAFARTRFGQHTLTVRSGDFLVQVVYSPPVDNCGQPGQDPCTSDEAAEAAEAQQALSEVLQPSAENILEALKGSPGKRGKTPNEQKPERVNVKIGAKRRDVCSLLSASQAQKVVGALLGSPVGSKTDAHEQTDYSFDPATGQSTPTTKTEPGNISCSYSAVDSVFRGSVYLAVFTTASLRKDLADPAVTARIRLDNLKTDNVTEVARYNGAAPIDLPDLGDAAFSATAPFTRVVVVSGDVVVELSNSPGDLEEATPESAEATINKLKRAAAAVVKNISAR